MKSGYEILWTEHGLNELSEFYKLYKLERGLGMTQASF